MKVKIFISMLFGYVCAMISLYIPPIGIMSGDMGVVATTHHPAIVLYTGGVSMGLLLYAWIAYEKRHNIVSKDRSREEDKV